jgi:hypothetical protein
MTATTSTSEHSLARATPRRPPLEIVRGDAPAAAPGGAREPSVGQSTLLGYIIRLP